MERACLMCGSTEALTIHHLLPKGTWWTRNASRRKVTLCWPCHLPLHRGDSRREQWERLWHLLTEDDRRHVLANCHPGTHFAALLPQWITEAL